MTEAVKKATINLDYEWPKNEHSVVHETVHIDHKQPDNFSLDRQNFPIEGLSRHVDYFQTVGNVEVFMQAACIVLRLREKSIAVGGLGNEISNHTVLKIVRVAAANRIKEIYTGIGSTLSRPAMSYLTKKQKCWGFLVHNCRKMLPKYNEEILAIDIITPEGWPVLPCVVENIMVVSQIMPGSLIVPTISYRDLVVNTQKFVLSTSDCFTISVVDAVSKYTEVLKSIFDFNEINKLLSGAKYFRPFRILIDCNGGAAGAYAKRIFEVELGAGSSVINHQPKNHPESLHPSKIGSLPIESEMKSTTTDFGATLDTDGSRVILYGQRGFQIPVGETVAILTSHYQMIPRFQKGDFNGVGRTYFTTSSVDDVLQKGALRLRKAPGSWLHFNALMKKECVTVCEDENYGAGSDHVGCSDGIWTILAWLTMVIHLYKPVANILTDHWTEYGRCFLTVYEFHNISRKMLSKVMHYLKFSIFPSLVGSTHTCTGKSYTVMNAGSMIFQGLAGPEIGFEDITLRIKVRPTGQIYFKTVVDGDKGTLRIVVEVQTKEIPYNSNKLSVTNPLLQLAMTVTRVGILTKKTNPDLVY